MLIEDKELRDLYEAASTEHLDNLEAGVLHLEKAPDDLSNLKDLLREAHSLKGDSRMLGVQDAETLTHQLETLLQSVQAGQPATPELCDRLYKGLDALRQIAHSAVTGDSCSVNTFEIMTVLMGGTEADSEWSSNADLALQEQPEGEGQADFAAVAESKSQENSDDLAAFAAAVALASHSENAQKAELLQSEASEVESLGAEPVEAELFQAEPLQVEQTQTEAAPEVLSQAAQFHAEIARLAAEASVEAVAEAVTDTEATDMESIALSEAAALSDTVATSSLAADVDLTTATTTPLEVVSPTLASSPETAAEPTSYWIEDDELRSLYEVASTEHLDNLETGCLQLEKSPDDRSMMKDLLREAHSLKGDSRMLGVKDAETLTHQLETLLQEVDQGKRSVDAELCDRLYKGLDAIRQIAHSAVTGDPCSVNTFQAMAQLMGAEATALPETAAQSETAAVQSSAQAASQQSVPATTSSAAVPSQRKTPVGSQQPKPVAHSVDTIRVASAKLDTLITQVSELSVAKRRIVDWTGRVTEMLDFWEGWTREVSVHQLVFGQVQEQLDPDVAQPLQAFYRQNQRRIEQLGHYVQQFRGQTSEDGARLDLISGGLEEGIRNLRMLPLAGVFGIFRRMVRDLSTQQGKDVDFIIEGGDTQVDKRIIEEIKDPLSHLLRNAIDHGIETATDRLTAGKPPTATLRLQAYRQGGSVIVEIVDDGKGLDLEKIKQTALRRKVCTEAALAKMTPQQIQLLIFSPGFSTRTEVSEISGRGVGLDVVRTNVEQRLKGSISVDSTPGKGCQFQLTLNPSLATTQALVLNVHQAAYAMPIEYVDRMVTVTRDQLFAIKGNLTTTIDEEPISVAWLSDLLELPASVPTSAKEADLVSQKIPCIVVKVGEQKLGLFVDELLEQQEIILKPQSKLLQRVRNLAGSTILGNGEVCLVLNPQDLFKTALKQNGALDTFEQMSSAANNHSRILLVEDSIPIRTQVKRILEGAGYEVVATVDGLDGYNTLRNQEQPFAAIVSDVEMPNMTGLELAAKVREHREYDDLPFVLVTTLATDADRQRGRDAGANAYLTKGDFDQSLLLDTLRGLIQS